MVICAINQLLTGAKGGHNPSCYLQNQRNNRMSTVLENKNHRKAVDITAANPDMASSSQGLARTLEVAADDETLIKL